MFAKSQPPTIATTLFVTATLIVVQSVADANHGHAQDHTRRRRGAILGGLAGAALGVAIGDKGDNETAGALIGGAAGGVIGNQRDVQRRGRVDARSPYQTRPHHGPGQFSPIRPTQVHRPAFVEPTQPHPQYYDPVYSHHQFSPTPNFQRPSVGPSPQGNLGYSSQDEWVMEQNDPPRTTSTPFRPTFAPVRNAPIPLQSPNVVHGKSIIQRDSLSTQDIVALSRSGISDTLIIQQIEKRGMAAPVSVGNMIDLYNQGVSEAVLEAMRP